MGKRWLGWIVLAALASSCASTYVPRRSQVLRIVVEGGQPMLVKQGRLYPIGVFGAGLVEVTEDNPRALEHAEAFHQGMTWGFVGYLAGLGVILASPVALAAGGQDRNGQPTSAGLGIFSGLLLGGMVVTGFGLASLTSAQPRMYDAINQYNDDLLFASLPEPEPATPAGAARPAASDR